jgi:hypothetical protein
MDILKKRRNLLNDRGVKMLNYEEKTITVAEGLELTGNQVYLLVQQEMPKTEDSKTEDDPYEIITVKLGNRTGQEPIEVGESIILLQRVQLKVGWQIVQDQSEKQKQDRAAGEIKESNKELN